MKIPPDREADILAKAGEGWSHQRIADWLASDHNIEVSRVAITKLLGRIQGERSETAKAIVREKLAGTVAPGLDQLGELTSKVKRLAGRLYKQTKVNNRSVVPFLKAVEQLRKNIDTQLHYSGADSPDDRNAELAAAAAEVARRLGAQPAAEGEDGGAAPPGSDDEGASGPSLPVEILGKA